MVNYNICMFAYNEEKNIAKSIASVKKQCSENLKTFYLLANGCRDKTVEIAQAEKDKGFEKLQVIEIELGDKCNAWNLYMHEISSEADVHFFVDADVQFSENCFDKLTEKLTHTPDETVAIAGMPLSGRNRELYESLVTEKSCFFGNLYGLKQSFVNRVQEFPFRLPIGLNWIDSFLTKAVNTDLTFGCKNLPNRVCYLEGVGYKFDKLPLFSWSAAQLYLNRIARYELGKIQEKYLDQMPAPKWPSNMQEINRSIRVGFAHEALHLNYIKRYLVERRLSRLLKTKTISKK